MCQAGKEGHLCNKKCSLYEKSRKGCNEFCVLKYNHEGPCICSSTKEEHICNGICCLKNLSKAGCLNDCKFSVNHVGNCLCKNIEKDHISNGLSFLKKEQFREIIQDIHKVKIGYGGFGDVYKFEYDGEIYALKQIALEKLDEKDKNNYEQEAKFLSKFNSEYIVKYYDSFKEGNKFNIIMEYAGNQTLKSFIKNRGNKLIDPKTLNIIIKQICLGLKEIHDSNIIHRDISPDNIFIDETNLTIKIGDFGISTASQYSHSAKGKYKYMAPEMQTEDENEIRYNKKVDIYALGCVIYELINYRNYFDDKMRNKIIKVNLEFYDKKWQILIDSMLAIEYHDRPSIENILSKLD